MKILIDIRLLSRGNGGVAEYTYNLVDSLIKLAPPKFHFQLFYNGYRKRPLPSQWLSDKNVSVIDWPCPNKIFRLANIAIDHLIKTDLIFSPHLDFLKHTDKVPRIITIHDLSFIHYPHFFSYKQRFWHWWQKIHYQVQHAQHIITDSEYSKNDIVETLKISPEKVSVIYPGINTVSHPERNEGSLRDSSQAQNDDKTNLDDKLKNPYILYLGTLEPRKNINAIIKSFNIIKREEKFIHLKLILAGQSGWCYKKIFAEANQSPYRQDIIFLGSVTAEEKFLLYTKAEAFIYPSFFEGFGFPPLEAQSANCPVIVSNRSSLPEIIKDSALKINPWRTDELADAIKKIISNEQLKQKIINAGQINIKNYSWEKCVDQLLKVFSS